MYGVAETLASRVPKQEEYIARVPAIAIVPWFLAGSLFPISALPTFLAWIARFLPLTHGARAHALRVAGRHACGLHNIWGMANATTMASLSLLVVAVFAAALSAISVRVFAHAALH